MTIERCDANLPNDSERLDAKAAYQVPEISVTALRLVTLGGSPGGGDSGSPNSQAPFGNSSGTGGWEDESTEPMPKDPDR